MSLCAFELPQILLQLIGFAFPFIGLPPILAIDLDLGLNLELPALVIPIPSFSFPFPSLDISILIDLDLGLNLELPLLALLLLLGFSFPQLPQLPMIELNCPFD